MNVERAIDPLRRLGLSDYEARAYVTLLTMGQLTPAEVSSAAQIPYTKVYEVLRRLEGKGWVAAVSRSPLTYAPVKPEKALASVKRRFEEILSEAEATLRTLEQEGGGTALGGLYVLRSFEALKRVARSIVSSAREVLVMIADQRLLDELAPILAGRTVRGVVEASAQPPESGEWRRARILLPLDMLISDRERLLLHFSILDPHGGLSGVLVSDQEIAEAAGRYFEKIWELVEQL